MPACTAARSAPRRSPGDGGSAEGRLYTRGVGSIGPAEILVVLVVALVVLGPNRLPEAARQAGRALAEFRRISSGFQAELRDAMNQPVAAPPAPPASAGPVVEAPGATGGDPQPAPLRGDLPTSPDQAELPRPGPAPNGAAAGPAGPDPG